MKIDKVNRERRKTLIYPDFKCVNASDDMHMTKKPHHWIQEIFYTKGKVIVVAKPAVNMRRVLDERKCA